MFDDETTAKLCATLLAFCSEPANHAYYIKAANKEGNDQWLVRFYDPLNNSHIFSTHKTEQSAKSTYLFLLYLKTKERIINHLVALLPRASELTFELERIKKELRS